MLNKLTNFINDVPKLLVPKVTYTDKNIRNSRQAEAAEKVASLEARVDDVFQKMQAIDETEQDANNGQPGKVYGQILSENKNGASYHLKGFAEFSDDGLVELDGISVSGGTRIRVKTDGEKTEIHSRTSHEFVGPDLEPTGEWMVNHEWVIRDGDQVTYKSIGVKGGNDVYVRLGEHFP